MNNFRLVKISKYLSKVLRHQPERIGLKLAPGGWVSVEELLSGCAKNQFFISRAELDEVVAKNDKKRFSFDQTLSLIRANQGHSVEIDLELEPIAPPDVLYHGSGHGALESILETGLCKMSRHHVHLSADVATAKIVGKRKGNPVIFAVDAAAMQEKGFLFYRSQNGVWLVENVPPEYLKQLVRGKRQEAKGKSGQLVRGKRQKAKGKSRQLVRGKRQKAKGKSRQLAISN